MNNQATHKERGEWPPSSGFNRWLVIIVIGFLTDTGLADDWPQWRGSDRLNSSGETNLLKEWPTNGPPLLWRVAGLGEGIASMAIARGKAYTLGDRDGGEFVFALDAASGESRWATRLGPPTDPNSMFAHSLMRWLSPRVPTVDEDRLYTITAVGELSCLRTKDGAVVWSKSYPTNFHSPKRPWGFCDYPLVDGENLICVPGGPEATVVALNKRTGELVWKTVLPGDETSHYAAPVISSGGGIRHYIVFLHDGLTGIAAKDGRVLWRYGKTARKLANSYTPMAQDNFVFSANGYGGGMALLKLVPSVEGIDVVEQYYQKFNFNPFQDSTVLVGEQVYAMRGTGEMVCIELKSGTLVWGPEGSKLNRRAALTYADGHLYLRRSDGLITLVEATPKAYIEKSSFQLPDPEEVSGVTFPVVANGRLYLRDNSRLLCYDVRANALSNPAAAPKTLTVTLNSNRRQNESTNPVSSRTGVDREPDAIFVVTPQDIVEKMIEAAGLTTDSVLYDLGSGDGRIVLAAARKHGCQTIGIEIDPKLVEQSRENVRTNRLESLVRINHADIFAADLSGADVITVYLPPNLLERLRPQFEKLKPGARIVSHQFQIPGVRPSSALELISQEDGDRHRIFVWKAPLKTSEP